jgi:hypothetical protein
LPKGGQPDNKNAEKWTEEKALKLANDLINWQNEPPVYSYDQYNNPIKLIKANLYYKYFLTSNGYCMDLIGNLSEKFKSFSELINRSKQIQESKISELAIMGLLNSQFTTLFMKVNHKYIEYDKQQELDRREREFQLKLKSLEKVTNDENLNIDELKAEINKLVSENGFH